MHRLSLAALVLALATTATQAQDLFSDPKNLQVLPKSTTPLELRDTMRGFALGLGLRCESCHLGEPGQPLTEFDFSDDSCELKAVAREMLRLQSDINATLAALPGGSSMDVSCETCHRGVRIPRTTRDELMLADEQGGVDAVIARYEELRETFYGTHSYDFSEELLSNIARTFFRQDRTEDARALALANLEYFPDSLATRSTLAEVHFRNGELAEAERIWNELLELELDVGSRAFIESRLVEIGRREASPDG